MPVTHSAAIAGRRGPPAFVGGDPLQHASARRPAVGPRVPRRAAGRVRRRGPADGALSRSPASRVTRQVDVPRRPHLRLCRFRRPPRSAQALTGERQRG